jgi:co-chaperonin GroES (HSP10)
MTETTSKISGIRALTSGNSRLPITGEEFKKTFQPAFDWCLIKMTDRSESIPKAMKDAGLVEITQVRHQARNKDGVVIRIGPHKYDADYEKTSKPEFNVGDRVYYGAWSGQETPCPEGYILVRSRDIKLLLDPKTRLEWI